MKEPTIEELKDLLSKCYGKLPSARLGQTSLVDFDPAGSTYSFEEYDWSKRVREILNIKYEPTGI